VQKQQLVGILNTQNNVLSDLKLRDIG